MTECLNQKQLTRFTKGIVTLRPNLFIWLRVLRCFWLFFLGFEWYWKCICPFVRLSRADGWRSGRRENEEKSQGCVCCDLNARIPVCVVFTTQQTQHNKHTNVHTRAGKGMQSHFGWLWRDGSQFGSSAMCLFCHLPPTDASLPLIPLALRLHVCSFVCVFVSLISSLLFPSCSLSNFQLTHLPFLPPPPHQRRYQVCHLSSISILNCAGTLNLHDRTLLWRVVVVFVWDCFSERDREIKKEGEGAER